MADTLTLTTIGEIVAFTTVSLLVVFLIIRSLTKVRKFS